MHAEELNALSEAAERLTKRFEAVKELLATLPSLDEMNDLAAKLQHVADIAETLKTARAQLPNSQAIADYESKFAHVAAVIQQVLQMWQGLPNQGELNRLTDLAKNISSKRNGEPHANQRQPD